MSAALLSLLMGLASLGIGRAPISQEEPPPYPVGSVTLEDVLRFNPEYQERIESYTPDPHALEYLRRVSREITIEVFYGGWCSDSREYVPQFVKVMREVHNPHIVISFVAVDEEKEQPAALIKQRHVELVPTFIVYADGHEIGRIVETPKGSVEEHLVNILKSPQPPSARSTARNAARRIPRTSSIDG